MWLDSEQENPQDPYGRASTASTAGNVSVGTGGGATGQPGGTTSNPSTQAPIQPQQPKQDFATVQDYLKGNQVQGEQLGQKVTGSLDTSLSNEKNTINQAAQQAKSDITAGTTAYDPNLVSTAVKDPTAITNSPDQLSSFLKQWNAAYSGPSSFETSTSYAPATAAVTEAQNKKAETDTVGGQQQLLQEQFGVYGQGNKALDQAILEGSSYYPKVQEQGKQFGTVQDYLTQAAAGVNPSVATAQQTSDATKAATQAALTAPTTGAVAQFKTNLGNEVTAAQQIAQQRQDAAKAALGYTASDLELNPNLVSDQTLSDLGMTRDQYITMLYQNSVVNQQTGSGINPLDYTTFQNPSAKISQENIATPEEYARDLAYAQLTGQSPVLNQGLISQAGTAPKDLTDVNNTDLTTYLQQRYAPIKAAEDARLAKLASTHPVLPIDNRPIGIPEVQVPTASPNHISVQPVVEPSIPTPSVPTNQAANIPFVVDPTTGNRIYNQGGEVENLKDYFKRNKR